MKKQEALELLRKAVNNPDAQFRTGQWEAIDALVNHRRKMLVVERTGWEKAPFISYARVTCVTEVTGRR